MNLKKFNNVFTTQRVLYVSIAMAIGISFYSIGIINSSKQTESKSAVIENKNNGQPSLPVSSSPAAAQNNTSINTPSSRAQTTNSTQRQNASQNVSRISTSIPPAYTPPTYSCNQEMATYAATIRDINISSENARYQQKLNQTSGYYAGRGLSDSSFSATALDLEKSIHESNIQSIYYTYKSNMQNAHCL